MPAKVRTKTKAVVEAKSRSKPGAKIKPANGNGDDARVVNRISPPNANSNGEERKPRGLRLPQYAYMKAPGIAHDFQVGDTVEVYCDHEKNKDRILLDAASGDFIGHIECVKIDDFAVHAAGS